MYKREKITIGITCFNAEKTIALAIESAFNQSWSNKEIIIVDDGSKDRSQKIIQEKIKGKGVIFKKNS